MLTEIEIEQLFVQFDLPEAGRRLVRAARANSPVRRANSRIGNSVVWQYSSKMGDKHLEVESRTVEAPAATLYEDDENCLEYWPQPFQLDLLLADKDDRKTSRSQHVPDFLAICRNGIFVDEWREESRLIRLAGESSQFYKDQDNKWHYKAAEDSLANTELKYRLRSAAEHPKTFVMNVRFLESYHSPACAPLCDNKKVELQNIMSERGSIPFLELLNEYDLSADEVFTAIVNKLVFVDMYNSRLDVSTDLVVHRDRVIAQAYNIINSDREIALPIPGMAQLSPGARVIFDGSEFEVTLVGGDQVLLKDKDNKKVTLPLKDVVELYAKSGIDISGNEGCGCKGLADLSKEQIEIGMNRLEMITAGSPSGVSERTFQRYKKKIEGAISVLDKIIALSDSEGKRGNHDKRLPDLVESLAEEAICKHFNTTEGRTALAVYQKYLENCEEQKVEPMSYPTFTKRVKEKASVKKRQGKRIEYQTAPIPLVLDYAYPVNGVRPHEVCYIDHTVLTIATVGPEGSKLEKPTLSAAADGNTTQTRAFFLSYDPPSVKSVMMVLRDYVRRHNRLPKILVVDGGKEFRSRELAWFCRVYRIDLRHRPGGMPRGGSPIERIFGATETEVLAKLQGNTRIMKYARMVTKSVNPFPNAVWTLPALYGALEEYLFEMRDTRIHPALNMTPRDYEAMRMAETGYREHLLVKFDQNLMLMTSPHSTRAYHTIDRQRGVWVDNMYYWHELFKGLKKGEKFEVRVEPWNANVVYVYFRNRWVAAIARDLKAFGGRTRREVQIAIRTERRLAKTNANKEKLGKMSAKKMVGLWAPEKYDERIGMQQREMDFLYSRLGMTVAMPEFIPESEPSAGHTNTEACSGTIVMQSENVADIISEHTKLTEEKGYDEEFWKNVGGYF